jgi:antirestriction protein
LKDIGIETADDLEDFCNVFYSDDNYYDFEVFEAAYGCDIPFEDVNEMYQGEWEDDETFVMRLLEDTGMIPSDLPNFIYIDWERTAENVMDDYVENRGHYFRQ